MAATPHEDPCMDSRTTRLNGNCFERDREREREQKKNTFSGPIYSYRKFCGFRHKQNGFFVTSRTVPLVSKTLTPPTDRFALLTGVSKHGPQTITLYWHLIVCWYDVVHDLSALYGARETSAKFGLHAGKRKFNTLVEDWINMRKLIFCCATNRKVAGSIPAGVIGFFIDIKSFRSYYGPGVDSASNRNKYQEYFLVVNEARA